MQTRIQDRLLGALGAGIVVALFGGLLLIGLSARMQARREQSLTLVELRPPPPPTRPKPPVERPRPRKASGRASPRNLRDKATDIVAPPVPIPPPTPMIAAMTPGIGSGAATGASDLPGPGEGAGGEGDGTGGGDDGDGDGDGSPRQTGGRLKPSDLPPDLVAAGIAGTVSVHYSVEVDGSVSDCMVTRSSGSAELDRLTCRLIEQRFRFHPSRDRDGRPVRSAIEENHGWFIDRGTVPAPRP